MGIDIQDKLEKLERQILTENISEIASATREWGGADVIIRSKMDESVKRWLGNNIKVISLQSTAPKKRAVITKY